MIKRLIPLAILLLLAVPLNGKQAAASSSNLIACPWFRYDEGVQEPFPAVCGEWTRDNNVRAIQDAGIPSPDGVDGTALQFVRLYCCISEVYVRQVVEASPGLKMHLSAYYKLGAGDDLNIRLVGRDNRYGLNPWTPVWEPLAEVGGNGAWQYFESETVIERPFNYYMIEIRGNAPLPVYETAAEITGISFEIEGSAIYIPFMGVSQ